MGEDTPHVHEASSSKGSDQYALGLDQGHTPMFLAQKNLGLKIGATYTVKDFPTRLWTVTQLTDSEIQLTWVTTIGPNQQKHPDLQGS